MTREEMELAIGRVVLERGPNLVAVADASGRIRYVNGRFMEITGWTEEEVLGWELDRLSLGDTAEAWRSLREGREWRGELEARRRSGDTYWEFASITPVRSAEGKIALYLKVSEDITDRKRVEADLLSARDEAEKAAETRSGFLANMSHEIRTPIHAIIGNTELLQSTELNEEQKDYTQTVRLSADVLLTLINDILDVSKIESGRFELENIGFDVCAVAEEAVDLIALQAHRKGLEIVTFFPDRVPHLVTGDPLRVRQIIVNLLNNAVKFTENGEIELSVEVFDEAGGSSCLKFSVRDTGIGIPPGKIAGLFQPFTQLDTSTTRKFGGTGLGLAICRRLAELMGGETGVESREGAGSTFWFTACFRRQEVFSSYAAVPLDFFDGLPVLLVDDNAASRASLGKYLRSWGCILTEASNGAEALSLMRKKAGTPEAVRIALVDLRLPGMDGWQLASEVNADPAVNATRLVLLTPFGLSAEEAKMKLLKWFDAYLTKPVKKNLLFETLFRVAQLEDELEGAGDAEVTEPDEGAEAAMGIGPARILIAEDHETNRQLFSAVLTKMGHSFSMASDGREAVDMARSGAFDLIFMDVQMPVMNGLEASRAIRAAGNTVPIIAVTASATKKEEQLCRESGMDDFLTKPFRMRDLAEVMGRWLNVPETREEPDALPGRPTPPSEGHTGSFTLDFSSTVSAFMGNRRMAADVLSRFLKNMRSKMPELAKALHRGDFRSLGLEAHGIRGGALNLCARELAEAAAGLERAASMADPAGCRSGFEELSQSFGRLSELALREGFTKAEE